VTGLGRRARTQCKVHGCGEKVEVGERSIHLVEKHRKMPPLKWLKKHGLPEDLKKISEAMKKNRNLRPPYKWIYDDFDFPNRQ